MEDWTRRTSCSQRTYRSVGSYGRPVGAVLLGVPGQEDPQVGLDVEPRATSVSAEVGGHRHLQHDMIGRRDDAEKDSRRGCHTSRCVTGITGANALRSARVDTYGAMCFAIVATGRNAAACRRPAAVRTGQDRRVGARCRPACGLGQGPTSPPASAVGRTRDGWEALEGARAPLHHQDRYADRAAEPQPAFRPALRARGCPADPVSRPAPLVRDPAIRPGRPRPGRRCTRSRCRRRSGSSSS